MCELAVFLSGHLPKGLLKQPFNLVYCLHILEVLCYSTLASSSFWSACFCMILPTSKNKSTENLGIMGHFPSSSYGLGISYRLLQAPFCDFPSKKEVSSILLLKKWYSEFERRPKRAYAVKQKSLPEAEEILSKSAKQMLAL